MISVVSIFLRHVLTLERSLCKTFFTLDDYFLNAIFLMLISFINALMLVKKPIWQREINNDVGELFYTKYLKIIIAKIVKTISVGETLFIIKSGFILFILLYFP